MKIKQRLLALMILSAAASYSPTQADTMLGSYIKHDGWSTDEIDKFNTDAQKPLAITTLFSTFDMHWDSLNIQTSNIVSRGATPMITFMPYSERHPDMLHAIASGQEDTYINSWVQSFKAWRDSYPEDRRPSILLRFAHEFNGNWYPWSNNPEGLKAAWRHLHAQFEAAGVNDSVEWVWCASATDTDDYNDITAYYPGGDVVDWTSLDGYNWGSNYTWTSWRSFDEVFSAAYTTLMDNYPDKPVILAEVGSAEPGDLPDPEWGQHGDNTDAGESKETWVADMMQSIMNDYPAIRAISWFNINKELSWALNDMAKTGQLNTGLIAYNEQAANDHFIGTFASLKTETSPETNRDNPPATNKGKGKGKGKPDKNDTGSNGKGNRKSAVTTAGGEKQTGLQRAAAVSRMPEVVGEKLREKEAEGMRNMPKKYLKKITESRLQLGK